MSDRRTTSSIGKAFTVAFFSFLFTGTLFSLGMYLATGGGDTNLLELFLFAGLPFGLFMGIFFGIFAAINQRDLTVTIPVGEPQVFNNKLVAAMRSIGYIQDPDSATLWKHRALARPISVKLINDHAVITGPATHVTNLGRSLLSMKSFYGKAIITFILYYVGFFITGLILNIIFLSQANTIKRTAPVAPAGRGCLIWIICLHLLIPPILCILALTGVISLPFILF